MKSWATAFLAAPLLLVAISISVAAADFSVKFFDKGLNDSSRVEILANPTTHKYNLSTGQLFYADVILNAPDLPTGAASWTSADFAFGWATDAIDESDYFALEALQPAPYWGLESSAAGHFQGWDGTQGSSGWWSRNVNWIAISPGNTYTMLSFGFTNKMAVGQSADIRLWNVARGTGDSNDVYTTALKSNLGYYMPDSSASVEGPYTLTTIPEPSSLMAMGCAGVGVLGNLWHRRRKKKSLDA